MKKILIILLSIATVVSCDQFEDILNGMITLPGQEDTEQTPGDSEESENPENQPEVPGDETPETPGDQTPETPETPE